jgi:hypothetical protein
MVETVVTRHTNESFKVPIGSQLASQHTTVKKACFFTVRSMHAIQCPGMQVTYLQMI